MSRSVKPDYEARRADQARAQEADRVTARVQRDLGFAEHGQQYSEWVEELDALPVGSVVLHNGRAFQHYPAYPAPFDEYQKWKCGDGGFVRSTKSGDMILPALVLHEAQS